MIDGNYELIEKAKWSDLVKRFTGMPDYYSPECLYWEKTEDRNRFYSLVEKNDYSPLSVTIRKKDIDRKFCAALSGRIMEVEWFLEDTLIFRMLDNRENRDVSVKLGASIPLAFYDNQIFFDIRGENLFSWLETDEKSISEFIRYAKVETEDWSSVLEGGSEYVEKNTSGDERYISVDFTLEKFLFSNDRIPRYFTAVDDADSLDFALTYRNCDIVNAIKNDSLETYLKSCDVICVKAKAFPLLLSLLYPSYLKAFGDFLKKLLTAPPSNCRDDLLEQLWASQGYRREVSLSDCAVVLKKLREEFTDLEKRIDQLEKALTVPQYISAQDKARAYDRSTSSDSADLAKRWNDEDLVRFAYAYSPVIGKTACETMLSIIYAGRESRFWEIFAGIKREDISNGLFSQVGLPLKHLFSPAVPEDSFNDEKGGVLAGYLCLSTWNDRLPITFIGDRGDSSHQQKIYEAYLQTNMFLEYAAAQLSAWTFMQEKLLTVAKNLADIEYLTIGKLSRNDCKTAVFSQDGGIFKLMPESHILLVDALGKKAADTRAQVQRDNFVTINHSIKNLISSINGALSRLERRLPSEQEFMCFLLKQAKQGVVIASELANAITCSYRQTGIEAWHEDLLPENAKWSIRDILHDALSASIPHMFFRNYSQYERESKNYFPDENEAVHAENSWYDLSDIDARLNWINKNLFQIKVDDAEVTSCKVGNKYSTKTHLYILFNEVLLNAVKAASYVDKDQRMINIRLTYQDGDICVDISNSANQNRGISGGYGRIIIDNYKSMFNMTDFCSGYDTNSQRYQVKFTLPFSK